MESASLVSEKLNFIGSVHEKEWKVQAMCLRTWFY